MLFDHIPHLRLLISGAFLRGEQVRSWQSHGVALTTCELGNAPLFGAFPDPCAAETVALSNIDVGSETEGVITKTRLLGPAVSTARDGGLPSFPYYSLPCVRGEQMLSCKEPGGLFATCELGNGTWSVPFPDRARSLPRETVACQRQVGGVARPLHSLRPPSPAISSAQNAVDRSETRESPHDRLLLREGELSRRSAVSRHRD